MGARRRDRRRAARCVWLLFVLAGCDPGATAEPKNAAEIGHRAADPPPARERPRARRKPEPVDREGLLIGELPLAPNPIIDGDTIRVEGIESSVRLLSLDTEERLHGSRERAQAAEDFAAYRARRRAARKRPPSFGTPMGEEAAAFAEAFFEGVTRVRLERDDPKEVRGYFGRPLAYAFVERDGRWTSYNVECVRAGMSPYFTKYGYSHRFHNQLTHAEAEAQEAKRGIWNPEARGYGDYEERKAWWNARADFIRAFEHEAHGRDDFVQLSHADAMNRLAARLGSETTVLSTVDDVRHFERLVRVSFSVDRDTRFPIIFFDRQVFEESGIDAFRKEPVRVRGVIELYEKGSYRTLQIVVRDPDQITLPTLP